MIFFEIGDIVQSLVPNRWQLGRVAEVIDLDGNGNYYIKWERKKGESKVHKKEWVNKFHLVKINYTKKT